MHSNSMFPEFKYESIPQIQYVKYQTNGILHTIYFIFLCNVIIYLPVAHCLINALQVYLILKEYE